MLELPPEGRSALDRVVQSGSALAGGAGGAVVGAVIAGPPGAIAGWAVVELVKAGAEVAQRWLSPRAEARVGAILRLASDEVSARIMNGETPREDLRAEIAPGRSQAEELAGTRPPGTGRR